MVDSTTDRFNISKFRNAKTLLYFQYVWPTCLSDSLQDIFDEGVYVFSTNSNIAVNVPFRKDFVAFEDKRVHPVFGQDVGPDLRW